MPNTIASIVEVRDRLAECVGNPELELHRIAEIPSELHRHGIVETERLADLGALGGRRIERDDLVDGVASKPEHRKRDDPDRDHDADRLYRPAKSESEHLILSLLSRMRRTSLSAGKRKSPGSAKPLTCVGPPYSCLVIQ
jgi:hypothetical protein